MILARVYDSIGCFEDAGRVFAMIGENHASFCQTYEKNADGLENREDARNMYFDMLRMRPHCSRIFQKWQNHI